MARAARLFVRRAVYSICTTAPCDSSGGCADFFSRTYAARLGLRSPQEKRRPRNIGSVCLHAKSTLPWQLHNGSGIHHRFGQMVARNPFCRAISWHLFAGYARRIRDAGTTVWRKFSRIREGGAGFFASHNSLSNRTGEHKVRSKFVLKISRVSSSAGSNGRVGISGIQDLLSEMKLRKQNYFDGNAARIIAIVFAALVFWQPALLSAQSTKKPAASVAGRGWANKINSAAQKKPSGTRQR